MTGEFEPSGGYLVDGGFPYYAMKFDQTEKSFYGQPPMSVHRGHPELDR
jgi:hypothetical protein